MRSLAIDRHRLPCLVAWVACLLVVLGTLVTTAPQAYRAERDLEYLTDAERESLRAALDVVHLGPAFLAGFWLATTTVLLVTYVVLGWVLVRRGQPAGFATWLAIVMLALTCASYPPDIDERFPDRPVLQVVVLVLTLIAVSGFFLLPLVFPDGRFVPRWTALAVPFVVLNILFLEQLETPLLEGAIGIALEVILSIAFAGCLIGSAIYRYRKVSTPEQRRQTRVVLLGFVIGLPAFFIADAMMRNIDSSPLGIVFLFGFMILITVGFNAPFLAVGLAILNHRLFDIDVILSRTLTWLAMTIAVIGAYIGIVLGIGSLLDSERNLILSLLATGLVAVAFQPVRARVQRAVDRFVFGERDDPYAVLSRIGHRIESSLTGSDLLPQIVHTTADALRLPYVALFLDRAGGPELVAATGTVSPATLRLPLTYLGQPLGSLEVAQRSPGDAFSASDRRLLEDLARQIGIAAHTVTLANDLQRSREEIITSREEERRRLRRDLHDGLGAQLAALIMQAGSIRSQVRNDPDTAERDLRELRDELKAAVDDVRRLVHGLRPPALDELGLAGALRARLDRLNAHQGDGLAIRFEAPGTLPALPAAVEVAAINIVDEAVTNVVRHANARNLLVAVAHAEDALGLTIEDDGTGFDLAAITPGIGLQSMRERARELGGTWTMTRREDGSGCRITVRLPAPAQTP